MVRCACPGHDGLSGNEWRTTNETNLLPLVIYDLFLSKQYSACRKLCGGSG